MNKRNPILSEAPDALDGAAERLQKELFLEEKEARLTKEANERIKPFIMEIRSRRGLCSNSKS